MREFRLISDLSEAQTLTRANKLALVRLHKLLSLFDVADAETGDIWFVEI